MALPKVEYPVHVVHVVGLGDVKVRPFSGHEEKSMMTIKEGAEPKEIVTAIDEVIKACTFGEYGGSNLALYQMEQIFIGIRKYSVAPTSDISIENRFCSEEECPSEISLTVDLDSIAVEKPDGGQLDPENDSNYLKEKFTVHESLGFTAIQPSLERSALFEQDYKLESVKAASIAAIEKVFDSENVYTDFTDNEIVEWYEDLPYKTREDLAVFVLKAPVTVSRQHWQCENCGRSHEIVLSGLNDFFS